MGKEANFHKSRCFYAETVVSFLGLRVQSSAGQSHADHQILLRERVIGLLMSCPWQALRNGVVDAFQTTMRQLFNGNVPMTSVAEAAIKLLRVPSYLVPRSGRHVKFQFRYFEALRRIYYMISINRGKTCWSWLTSLSRPGLGTLTISSSPGWRSSGGGSASPWRVSSSLLALLL